MRYFAKSSDNITSFCKNEANKESFASREHGMVRSEMSRPVEVLEVRATPPSETPCFPLAEESGGGVDSDTHAFTTKASAGTVEYPMQNKAAAAAAGATPAHQILPPKKPPDIEHCDFSLQIEALVKRKTLRF